MDEAIRIIQGGGIGVILSDTIYGVMAKAFSKEAVERIYLLKERNSHKPFIVLISDIKDLETFSIYPSEKEGYILKKYWPGKVTFIFSCDREGLDYLHRGTKSLAFRLPNDERLISIIKETCPLVAPSANPEGLAPAQNIDEAKKYFGNKVDIYLDGGESRDDLPSTIVSLTGVEPKILRKGSVDVEV